MDRPQETFLFCTFSADCAMGVAQPIMTCHTIVAILILIPGRGGQTRVSAGISA
jgi:hypothetical protein